MAGDDGWQAAADSNDGSGSAGGDDIGSGAGDNRGSGDGGAEGSVGAGDGGGNNADILDTVMETVQATGGIGSGGQLNDILNPTDLFGGLGGGIGAGPLGTNGLIDTASGALNNIVSDVGQTAGAVANGGSVDGILNAVGNGAGNPVDGVPGVADGATGSGTVGGILDGLGGNVVNGAVGGTGLLSGTPIKSIQGDGALLGTGLLHGDDSSAANLIELSGGTDGTHGLINVNAAADRSASESNHVVDTNIGPDSSGSGIAADLLGANQDHAASLIDADAGQHQGASLLTVNTGTAADQFQFPALDGTGLDSLVGEMGTPPDKSVGGDLLPLSADVDGHALIDFGADGALDSGGTQVNDGTQITVNTPLHGALV